MAPRGLWKGQLRLSLVSIPVEIYSATKTSSKVSFRQIHAPSGKPVKYEKTVPGIGPVDASDIVKGFDTGDDDYMLIDPEEIDAIKLETKKTFELVQFVDACEIPPLYFDKPYYVVPTDELAQDAYRVVRDALRRAGKVGLGQITMRGKEHLGAIKPCGDGLLLETLHYADELREAAPMFDAIKDAEADEELLEVATTLIERKSGPFDAAAFTDHYAKALHALITAKRNNKTTKRVPTGGGDAPQGENVVDLMAALRESLKSTKATKAGGAGRRKKASSKRPREVADRRDRLDAYNVKRDFSRTREPSGEMGPGTTATLRFVVQKHAARRLHYDFRLEWDGVLLSWAVTKGPSGDPREKRLAVRTEDHPLSYGSFEGTIPKGQYGGGTVMLWDGGVWQPEGDVAEALDRGKLGFRLAGARMRGGWALVRMRGRGKRENWLLIKERDADAQDAPERLTEAHQISVTTGRTMEEIAAGAEPRAVPQPRVARRGGKRPGFRAPQLATLVGDAPAGEASTTRRSSTDTAVWQRWGRGACGSGRATGMTGRSGSGRWSPRSRRSTARRR